MEDFLSPEQVGKILHRSQSTLQLWRHKKIGPPWLNFQGKILYSSQKLLIWIEDNTVH